MSNKLTVGQLRRMLEQIGRGHDHKHVAVLINSGKGIGECLTLEYSAAVQCDRLLLETTEEKGKR